MSVYPDMSYEKLTFTHEVVRLDDDEEFKVECEWEIEYVSPGRNSRWRFDPDRYTVEGVFLLKSSRELTDSEIEQLKTEDVPDMFKEYLGSQMPF